MTFRDQINRTGWLSILAFVLAFCLLAISEVSGRGTQALLFWLYMPALAVGAVLMVFGVIGRLVHRWLWLRAVRDSTLSVGGKSWSAHLVGDPIRPFWRRWLHVDENGADLDRAG